MVNGTVDGMGFTTYSMNSIQSRLTHMDIIASWDVEGAPAPFVPCSSDRPTLKTLSKQESDYYFYWRSMARRGRYLRTSDGYLHLFTTEIVNIDRITQKDLDRLAGAVRAYGDHDETLIGMMSDACFTLARIHKLSEPPSDKACCFFLRSYRFEKLLESDPIGVVPISLIAPNLSAKDRSLIDKSIPYDELFTECLRRIDAWQVDVCGKRLFDYLPEVKRRQFDVFEGFPYFGSRLRSSVVFRYAFGDHKFFSFLKGTLRQLIRMVRISGGLSIPAYMPYPPHYGVIITDLVNSWAAGSWKPDDLDDGFELDSLRVDAARDDLEVVTGLMSVEESDMPEPEAPAGVRGAVSAEDPWTLFTESLDEKCRGYLSAVLDGSGASHLKSIGARMGAVEESINILAMDVIGDVVVEGGRMIPEYEEDVRRALG